ncbi:MAG: efflux RND transporter periplasmic adaptor subunit [Gammaproteobacteria bacterium]
MKRDTLQRGSRRGLFGLWFALLIVFSAAFGQEGVVQEEDDERVISQLGNIRGLVKPKSEARLSSEVLARITALPFKPGQRFREGDVLIRLDCSRYQAQLASAKAELNARSKTHENNRELSRLNAIGKLEVEISKAEADKAAAEARAAGVNVSRCVITAPYPGRLVESKVHEHETVAPEQELMTILDDRDLEIEIIVPSKWLTWLKVGTPFTFHVDETDSDYLAKVSELGARVDPVSQTMRVDGIFQTAAHDVLAGMSGTARFSALQ